MEEKKQQYDTRDLFKSELDMRLNSYYEEQTTSLIEMAGALRDYEQALLFRKLGYFVDLAVLVGAAAVLGVVVAYVGKLVGLA